MVEKQLVLFQIQKKINNIQNGAFHKEYKRAIIYHLRDLKNTIYLMPYKEKGEVKNE